MLLAEHLWTADGWQRDARIDDSGGELRARFVLPGMPNLHSHAFQRAMAGLAERRRNTADSFWTWRETMYAFASRVGPDDLRAIAAQLYVEMLKAGYTHVCEFHYLHHAPDGKPYADSAVMSLAIIEAAKEAGIGLTLLPVLYMTGGFDGRPLSERQRRFGMDVEAYLRLLERLHALESPMLRVGIALHSLRAVPEAAMREVLASFSPLASGAAVHGQELRGGANAPGEGTSSRSQTRQHRASSLSPGDAEPSPQPLSRGKRGFMPIHIHIAEQIGEVEECIAMRGARPVRWLLDHADVDARWCLVHATHLDESEIAGIAKSGAVAGLCPTTEANLGDGLFPLADYLDSNGTLGIGSDSHISVSPVEELRWLEYGQRLVSRQRNIAARPPAASVGEVLWKAATQGGTQASGIVPFGERARADFLVLDDQSPLLAARDQRNALDSFLFAGNTALVRDVTVSGEWVVRGFRHRDEERIASRYRACMERLAG